MLLTHACNRRLVNVRFTQVRLNCSTYSVAYASHQLSHILISPTGTAQVWDSSTGMELANFKGHKDVVQCCALSRSGKLVVSGSSDCTVKVCWGGNGKWESGEGD